jgi:hypothetical protein
VKFHHRWAATALFVVVSSVSTIAHAASVSGQGTWETTLQGRDLTGDEIFDAYYDTVLDITWRAVADAGDFYTWDDANAWAASLNIGGVTGWRLPYTNPVNGVAYDYTFAFDGSTDNAFNISAPGTVYAGSTGSEMAHMFFVTLGNVSFYDISGNGPQEGWGLINTGPFSGLGRWYYWSSTEYAPDTSSAWLFSIEDGRQFIFDKTLEDGLAWAVHNGDVGVSAVPVPAAAWLFGSGLLWLLGIARRPKAA